MSATVLETGILKRLDLVSGGYFIYPANFWPHKNHDRLLTAFDTATRSGLSESIKLVCTGAPGSRQTDPRDLAKSHGLDGRICFPGYLPDSELATLMAHATGLIFPSLYEGFGLPIIEAMAVGVPVACSHGTALPKIAGNAAVLFDPTSTPQIAAAMLSLAQDEKMRNRLIQEGSARAREFSDTRRMATEYWGVFQDALA